MDDDEVDIADVNDDDTVEIHHRPLVNQDLGFLHYTATELLAEYGWLLIVVVVGVVLLVQYISSRVSQRPSNTEPETDTVTVVRRQEGLDASRKRMQEELDAKAALFRERQLQLEEEKRRQKIESWDKKDGKGYKASPQDSDEAGSSKKGLRGSGYNPLSGGGGASVSFRPARRGPSAGG